MTSEIVTRVIERTSLLINKVIKLSFGRYSAYEATEQDEEAQDLEMDNLGKEYDNDIESIIHNAHASIIKLLGECESWIEYLYKRIEYLTDEDLREVRSHLAAIRKMKTKL